MKKFIFVLFMLATVKLYAQDVNSYIELLRSDLKTDKKEIITEAMNFSEKEAAAFWPVYRNYEMELDKQGDEKIALIKDYAEHYPNLSQAKAKELTQKSLEVQKDRVDLRKKYFKQFSKVLPATTVAKFMQVDTQLQLLIDLQLAEAIPLVKKASKAGE